MFDIGFILPMGVMGKRQMQIFMGQGNAMLQCRGRLSVDPLALGVGARAADIERTHQRGGFVVIVDRALPVGCEQDAVAVVSLVVTPEGDLLLAVATVVVVAALSVDTLAVVVAVVSEIGPGFSLGIPASQKSAL